MNFHCDRKADPLCRFKRRRSSSIRSILQARSSSSRRSAPKNFSSFSTSNILLLKLATTNSSLEDEIENNSPKLQYSESFRATSSMNSPIRSQRGCYRRREVDRKVLLGPKLSRISKRFDTSQTSFYQLPSFSTTSTT